MKPLFLLALGSVILCGCMHTEIGGNPEPSPDNRYVIATRGYGASGKPYVEKTKKRFSVWIGPNGGSSSARPFKKTYVFAAGSLDWNVNWRGSEEVAVELFDYGDGVSSIDARKAGIPSNHVAALLFRKRADGHFVEVK